MDPFRYRMTVEWSDEDEAFVARVPALQCAAHGDTEAEAVQEARVAADAMLESMQQHGEAAPPPDASQEYSGNIRLRLPRYLHERLARQAVLEGVSLNQYMVALLADGSGRADVSDGPPAPKAIRSDVMSRVRMSPEPLPRPPPPPPKRHERRR